MAHEVETMAYANAVPWHGLGKPVSSDISVDEMLVQAGLDWTVKLMPAYAYDAEADAVIDINRKALVRSTDKKVLTVVGDNWHPVQNAQAMEFFKNFTDAGGAKMETAGSLRGGKVIWGLASLEEQFYVNKKNDIVKGYVLLISRHEVGTTTQAFTTTVRVVCANTMRMAEASASRAEAYFKQNHMSAFDAQGAAEMMGLYRAQFANAKIDAQTLASLQMSEFDSVRLLAKFFQPLEGDLLRATRADADKADKKAFDKFIEQLLTNTDLQSDQLTGVINSMNNAPGAQPGTGWGVINGVTHWCDHVAGRSQDARLFNSWLGDRSRLKLQVNKELLSLAA